MSDDADGRRFRLRAANWDGAQGSWTASGDIAAPANHHAGQDAHGIPLGLDRVPVADLLADFHRLGLNSIRLPFSNEMIHTTAPVPDSADAANLGRAAVPAGWRRNPGGSGPGAACTRAALTAPSGPPAAAGGPEGGSGGGSRGGGAPVGG